MPSGGKREGAGRKPGVPNKASIDRQAKIAAEGDVPLDYMLRVMRDPLADSERRDEMAKAAAPYVHPRLSMAEIKNETTHRFVARIPEKAKSTDQWQAQLPSALKPSGKPSQDHKLN